MQPQSLMGRLTQGMVAGNSPLNQVTPGAPTFSPGMQSPSPSPMPNKTFHLEAALKRRGMTMPATMQQPTDPSQGQPMPQDPSQAQPGQPMPGQPAPEPEVKLSEVELILKALNSHLSHKDKLEAKVLEAALPKEAHVDQPQVNS